MQTYCDKASFSQKGDGRVERLFGWWRIGGESDFANKTPIHGLRQYTILNLVKLNLFHSLGASAGGFPSGSAGSHLPKTSKAYKWEIRVNRNQASYFLPLQTKNKKCRQQRRQR